MTDEGCTGDGRGRGHTYTASEVKVLTETASKVAYALGRKDAGEEIAAAFEPALYNSPDGDAFEHTHPKWEGEPECPACWVQTIRQILARATSQAPQAASDATSGVPGHQEVSEAVRSPQEPAQDADVWVDAPDDFSHQSAHTWEIVDVEIVDKPRDITKGNTP